MSDSTPGPDKTEIDWTVLDTALAFGPSRQTCADLLGISIDTLKRRVQEKHGMTFSDYAEGKFAKTKMKLITKAIEMGIGGNVPMLIFSLKNKCNWEENPSKPEERIDGMDWGD